MNDVCTYTIKILGQVNEAEINGLSPLQLAVTQADVNSSIVKFCADQSGLMGVMRHIHGMGFVFLSVERIEIKLET